jgi:hypothetical protein
MFCIPHSPNSRRPEVIRNQYLCARTTALVKCYAYIDKPQQQEPFSANIMFLDIIHRPVFTQKHSPVYFSKHNFSETGFCLRPQVKHTQLAPGTNSIDWAQLSRFYLRLETGSSLQNVVFWNINRTIKLVPGPNLVGFTWGRRQNPVSETLCFEK